MLNNQAILKSIATLVVMQSVNASRC